MRKPITEKAYQQRCKERREEMKHFLLTAVVPANFSSENVEVWEEYTNSARDGYESHRFCDWYGLGNWFEEEMEEIEFDIDDFFLDLHSKVEREEREAKEDYLEKIKDYQQAVGGGAMT